MSTLFILIAIITNNIGMEYSSKVSGEVWTTEQLCKIEQHTFKDATTNKVKFECIPFYADETKYFNKEQKFY